MGKGNWMSSMTCYFLTRPLRLIDCGLSSLAATISEDSALTDRLLSVSTNDGGNAMMENSRTDHRDQYLFVGDHWFGGHRMEVICDLDSTS